MAYTVYNCDSMTGGAARSLDILSVATPTQFGNIWDRMVKGENFDKLVDELGKVQAEWSRQEKARKEAAA